MAHYVEREVEGRIEWLQIVGSHWSTWLGCFCLLEAPTIPPEHVPVWDATWEEYLRV